ncbi:MAG TPA: hypothetical protein VID51_06190 [Solirubrobacterales bacterium]|jgi:hypothetical protein
MQSIHIVDDIPCARRVVLEGIKEVLGEPAIDPGSGEAIATVDSGWRFIWNLLDSGRIKAGDVVVSDLFPVSYWENVPGKPLYDPVSPLPEDPTNIYLAALDSIQRFVPRVPERRAHLVLVTYVPNSLEKDGAQKAADHIREVLNQKQSEERLTWFEKPNRENNGENFATAIDKVCELVRSQ